MMNHVSVLDGIPCPECKGFGFVHGSMICLDCEGDGRIEGEECWSCDGEKSVSVKFECYVCNGRCVVDDVAVRPSEFQLGLPL